MPRSTSEVSEQQVQRAESLGVPPVLRLYLNSLIDRCLGRGIDLRLVLIPDGSYTMGSRPGETDQQPDERPAHMVRITAPFYMGVYEVTQAQYEQVMHENASYFRGDELPVDSVSWNDAHRFCQRLGEQQNQPFRLPTEAEWEYACRAGTQTPFNTGATIDAREANIDGRHPYPGAKPTMFRAKTMSVGTFEPNAWGLYDMHGNVSEWCADWFRSKYYNRSPICDPPGPRTGNRRVHRGGSWFNSPGQARSASRARFSPAWGMSYFGFRVVMDVPKQQ